MAPTRAQFEAELVSRASGFLSAAGMATTTAGTNADLASPIAYALRASGYTLATAGSPVDADLAVTAADDEDQLYDLAELRLLENVYQRYTKVDSSAAVVSAKLDQLRQAIKERIAELRARVFSLYGIGNYAAFSVTLARADGYSDLANDDAL